MTNVIIKQVVSAQSAQSFYFVGLDEGWSVMSSVAMRFSDSQLGELVKTLNMLHKDIEAEYRKVPSNVRSIHYYPQQLGE